MKTISNLSSLIFSILILCFAISFWVYADWTNPSSPPTGGNVDAPLNIGATGQEKAGGLILNTGGAAIGLIIDQGAVGIGETNPDTAKLVVKDGTNATHIGTDTYSIWSEGIAFFSTRSTDPNPATAYLVNGELGYAARFDDGLNNRVYIADGTYAYKDDNVTIDNNGNIVTRGSVQVGTGIISSFYNPGLTANVNVQDDMGSSCTLYFEDGLLVSTSCPY